MNSNLSPKIFEWLLLAFAAIGGLYTAILALIQDSAYLAYYADHRIFQINIVALIIDIVCIAVILFWRKIQKYGAWWQFLLLFLCIFATVLTWTELWLGSTFHYGVVRDKQGLPFGVNNFGALGSFIFLSYVICRLFSLLSSRLLSYVGMLLTLILLWRAHVEILALVEESWLLWQT